MGVARRAGIRRELPCALASLISCADPPAQTPAGSSSGGDADDGPVSSDADTSLVDTGACEICSESSGTSTTTSLTSTTSSTTDASPIFDVGQLPDAPPVERCVQCDIALMTTQSNAMHTLVGMPLFLEADLDGNLVFGLGQFDAGRVAFSGDGNVIYREGTCPLWPWLGATGAADPRVLCIGADWPCHGLTEGAMPLEINALHMYPGTLDYGGFTLPPEYADDPVLLRSDYDVVVYIAVYDFETDGGWGFEASQAETLETYVRDEGGGLYLAGEYWGAMDQVHLDSLDAFAAPFDVAFEQLSLDWGPAGAMVEIDCFPEPAG